ncbi:hypothetical protein [Alcanivorax sp.]|jgi:hypothetical protein|uniref:hypothetical protein n=1 Tax=Alcanivorax sp. TaxID=1872427 RepID=UPI0039E53BF2
MTKMFSQHKQSIGEIRRLALLCYGLDVGSTKLKDGSSMLELDPLSEEVLHEQISCHLLSLAVALRVNFYQKNLMDLAKHDVRHYAGMYWEDEYAIVETTIKDVCDKIMHADIFSKSVAPHKFSNGAYATIQMQGTHRKRNWILDLSVALFCEKLLHLIATSET